MAHEKTDNVVKTARAALISPQALQQWAAQMYDLHISLEDAGRFLKKDTHRHRLCEYNLRLSLKWQLLSIKPRFPAPFPRPAINPHRINYPLDEYARQTGVTWWSMGVGQNEASPWQEIAIRQMEDSM